MDSLILMPVLPFCSEFNLQCALFFVNYICRCWCYGLDVFAGRATRSEWRQSSQILMKKVQQNSLEILNFSSKFKWFPFEI